MPPRDSVRVAAEELVQSPPAKIYRQGPLGAVFATGRNLWRRLTSMRTALILLFLLALASLPGALLPQWSLNTSKTATYIVDHPVLGPWLNRLGFFEVFASPWYAAIYLLLFTSLVGCLTPRSLEFIGQLRAKPVATPRNLSRLPHHDLMVVDGAPGALAQRIARSLRRRRPFGWRVALRQEAGGVWTVSAERGYLREIGNLLFHFALLGLLISMALGKMFGYAGSNIVTVGDGFCSASPMSYANFRPGLLVDGTDMAPFCVTVKDFTAQYTDVGQATEFRADIAFQSGAALATDTWQNRVLQVNDPLRFSGERLYLLGHGYSPSFRITYPGGTVRDYTAPFQPMDSMFTSQGVIKVTDPPGYSGAEIKKHQLAIVGIFAPTGVLNDNVLTSAYPAADAPGVAVQVYRGDLGMEGGAAQSIFAIDTGQVTKGALVSQGRSNLIPGQSMTLDDGTKITFVGATPFVSLQTSYDPAQGWALLSAVLLVLGLFASLTIKRRRVWYRLRPSAGMPGTSLRDDPGRAELAAVGELVGAVRTVGGLSVPVSDPVSTGRTVGAAERRSVEDRTVVEVGGLARTDQAGYGSEFTHLVALAADSTGDDAHRFSGDAPGGREQKGE